MKRLVATTAFALGIGLAWPVGDLLAQPPDRSQNWSTSGDFGTPGSPPTATQPADGGFVQPAAGISEIGLPETGATAVRDAAGNSPMVNGAPSIPVTPPAPMFPAGPSLAAAGDMIGFSRELAGGTQAITLISASRRWMAVYHIDQMGQIRLVSSRPLDADFSFQFNATAPLPDEIRRLQGK